MKNLGLLRKTGILSAFMLFSFLQSFAQKPPPKNMGYASAPQVSAATFERWIEDLSNWGRWGEDDQLGTLNLITPEKRIEAAQLVKTGKSISLAWPMAKEENMNNGDPLIHQLGTSGPWAGDTYTINYHGYAHSHIDALCHMASDGTLYNGFPADGRKSDGAEKLGIEHMANGIFSRGLLVDIAWSKGINYLEPGYAIEQEDLEYWEAQTGIQIGSGDVVLIRTGRWEREKKKGIWKYSEKASGLHASVAAWLKERGVAALGSDGASDVFPSGVEGVSHPVHQLVLHTMGMPILDNLNLEDLAEEALISDKWEFLFVATPLRIEGGTGSPLNPIAVF